MHVWSWTAPYTILKDCSNILLKAQLEREFVVTYRKLKNSCNTNPLLKVSLWYPTIQLCSEAEPEWFLKSNFKSYKGSHCILKPHLLLCFVNFKLISKALSLRYMSCFETCFICLFLRSPKKKIVNIFSREKCDQVEIMIPRHMSPTLSVRGREKYVEWNLFYHLTAKHIWARDGRRGSQKKKLQVVFTCMFCLFFLCWGLS